jgi:chondroitin AC lyase
MAAFDFAGDELTARKSWFFFDDEFVCLGAGITCPADAPVLTTLNQCHLRGQVAVRDGAMEKALPAGTHTIGKAGWVHHDGVGYVFPEPVALTVRTDPRPNSWKKINKRYPAKEGTVDVFAAWLDHGKAPKDASYRYVVVPGSARKDMTRYAKALPVKIVENTRSRQAVTHTKLKITGVAFYQKGTIALDDKLQLEVDQPCLVLVRIVGKKAELTVSDPRNRKTKVNVRVGKTRAVFDLPAKLLAGKSVAKTLDLK